MLSTAPNAYSLFKNGYADVGLMTREQLTAAKAEAQEKGDRSTVAEISSLLRHCVVR